MTVTQHSDESSSHDLIQYTDAPINAFKNQIILTSLDTPSYKFEIIFPTYHRHTISEPNPSTKNLTSILKKYLNPSVTTCIKTTDEILGKLQEIFREKFSHYKAKYTRTMVTDLVNEEDQENEIIKEHERAHRNSHENKSQLITRCYFPQMNAKIKRLTKQCKVCREISMTAILTKFLCKKHQFPNTQGKLFMLIFLSQRKSLS